MSFANAHLARLKALHRVKHVLQGEDATILLLKLDSATRGLVELASIDTGWSKTRIRPDFFGSENDQLVTFVEAFEIAESLLDAETANLVAGVRHGSRQYRVKIAAAPDGLQRYWRLQIVSVEEVSV